MAETSATGGTSSQPLRESDESFRLLVESVADYAIFLLDPSGHVASWNLGAERIKGYKPDEIIGKHFSVFYPKDAIAARWPQRALDFTHSAGRFEDQGFRIRKDGSKFWANVVITALYDRDRKIRGFSKVTRDMTDRKNWEDQIRALNASLSSQVSQLAEANGLIAERTETLLHLSTRLIQIQDAERRRIARELHEGLSQDLIAMKMMLDSIPPKENFTAIERQSLTGAIEIADRVLQQVRNLSYLLHPPLLDDAGLAPALRWLVDAFQQRTGIVVDLGSDLASFPRLSPEIEVAAFRIVQESLDNVNRHADSSHATVIVQLQDGKLQIQIRDYGKGFGSLRTDVPSPAGGAGISGMQHRVKRLGGELHISPLDPGTLVEAWLPC